MCASFRRGSLYRGMVRNINSLDIYTFLNNTSNVIIHAML